MTRTIQYKEHEIKIQHVLEHVQILLDNSVVAFKHITSRTEWDDYQFEFPMVIDDVEHTLYYGVHMGLVKDVVTVRLDEDQLDQYKMSVKDYLKLD